MAFWLDDDEDLDHGPGDTPDDSLDRDEYEPGGSRFEADTPSLEDHPMYEHFHRGAAEY